MTNPYQPPEIDDPNEEIGKPIQWRGYILSGGAIVIGITIVVVIELLGLQGDDLNRALIGLAVVGSLIGVYWTEKDRKK